MHDPTTVIPHHTVGDDGHAVSVSEAALILCHSEKGVKLQGKYAKRESERSITRRVYHLTKKEEASHRIKYSGTGFPKRHKNKNGILSHYHFVHDPDLPTDEVAVRRIPCACDGCMHQLRLPWVSNVISKNQDRYKNGGKHCKFHEIFDDLNDLKIITLHPKGNEGSDDGEIQEEISLLLESDAIRAANSLRIYGIGAIETDDPEADGYYIVTWLTQAYILQEDETSDGKVIKQGEWVAKGIFWSKVPGAARWYYPETGETMHVMVSLKEVLNVDLDMEPHSDFNKFPSCLKNKSHWKERKPCKLSKADDEDMMDRVASRARIAVFQEVEIEEDGDNGQNEDGVANKEDQASDEGEEESTRDYIYESDSE